MISQPRYLWDSNEILCVSIQLDMESMRYHVLSPVSMVDKVGYLCVKQGCYLMVQRVSNSPWDIFLVETATARWTCSLVVVVHFCHLNFGWANEI
jgi:hypothetical protein